MANRYAHILDPNATPQSQPIPGRESAMVENRAGGYVFALDKWQQLQRFLILGAEGPTYYASEREMVLDNAKALQACVAEDGPRAVSLVRDLDAGNRAPKRGPVIFALAYLSRRGDEATKAAASKVAPEILRTASDLFQYLSACRSLGKLSGRTVRSAIGGWYASKAPRNLAYQMAKYQGRHGFTHRDALRVGHPKPETPMHEALMRWAVKGEVEALEPEFAAPVLARVEAQKATSAAEVVRLIEEHDLVRECIPTEHLNNPRVWEALLAKMPMTATLRSLGKLGAVGLLAPLSDAVKVVADRLRDGEALKKARVHPIQVLSALSVYGRGSGVRGSLSWTPVQQVVDALNDAFYLAFESVEPTGLNWYLGIDVSGSMGGGEIAGVPGLTPRQGAACLAMVTAKTEANYYAAGFTSKGGGSWYLGGGGTALVPLNISPAMRLDAVVAETSRLPFGGTDCALPMLDAAEKGLGVDVFVVLTDNETWAGGVHPSVALDQYRQRSGRDAKLIVVGMTATGYSIADPSKPYMLDVVGFDSAAPQIMRGFALGEV